MNAKVTVLLALYNGAKYIEKQLDSLRAQTKCIDQLIIGDDGSTDAGIELVRHYIIEHHLKGKWTVIQNENNLGHAGNFINMCHMAEGDFVFFCDQDDIWMPDKIERMISAMENAEQMQLLYADVINTKQPEKLIDVTMNTAFDKSVHRIPFSSENYFFKGLGCATCVRGTFVKKMLSYWAKGWEHDMFFWACAMMTDSGYYYNAPVIWRRLHDSNASIVDVKTLAKRCIQVRLSIQRPPKLRQLLIDYQITDVEKQKFVKGYEKVLKRRNIALEKRNIFIATMNLLNGTKYYLHKKKGAILDIMLIIFKEYPIW